MEKKYQKSLNSIHYNSIRLTALVSLRLLIGWHFLYEGLTKLINPYWSSAGYLLESQWLFSSLLKSIVASPIALKIVDLLNIWGLILIGIGLIAGLFTRISTIIGIILLAFYYISNPPLMGLTSSLPKEGNYLIVNKTLIELAAMVVLLVFSTGHLVGLDIFLNKFHRKKE